MMMSSAAHYTIFLTVPQMPDLWYNHGKQNISPDSAMRHISKFIHTVIIITVILVLALYWVARTDFAAKCFAEYIESKTGLNTKVGQSRVTWRGVVELKNMSLSVPHADGNLNVVNTALFAPSVELKMFGYCKKLRLDYAEINLKQYQNGVWTPAILKEMRHAKPETLPAVLTGIGAKFPGEIAVDNATFYVTSADGVLATYTDASFYHKPLRLKGQPSAAYGSFKTQGIAYAENEINDFKTEWFAIGDRIILLGDTVGKIDTVGIADTVEIIDNTDTIDDDDDPWF